ncbi:hypothetical protein FB45DRAFT_170306 [Roridomyces roridus]|uniref:Uncharacterized protein n=1 Tax=Roridomyces roridus TaxID=1738132 RepID=A0AAD7FE75_9AGAR|nr:hypothetical protein FB45DRAFT_170306 [Roridomyces roridus]
MSISLAGASLLGCIFATFLYGIFTTMAAFTAAMLRKQKRGGSLMTVLGIIWVLSSGLWIINVYRAYQAFIVVPDGPEAFYNNFKHPSYTARIALYVFLTVIVDSFAVYRAFIVWSKKWSIVVIPALVVIATAVSGIGTIIALTTAPAGDVIFNSQVVPWITSWILLTLSTNVICTILIAVRITSIRMALRNATSLGSNSVWGALIVVIESAGIYSLTAVVLCICYLLKSNSQFTALDVSISIIGVTFTMIILRVGLKISSEAAHGSTNHSTGGARIPVRGADLAVNVTRLVEVSRDPGLGSEITLERAHNREGKDIFTEGVKDSLAM